MNQDGSGLEAEALARGRRQPTKRHVATDYEVISGCVFPRFDGERRSYSAFVSPSSLSDFIRMRPGNEGDALAFARRWGTVGFDAVAATHGIDSGAPEVVAPHVAQWIWAGADPLPWIWAHASGLAVGMSLIKLLKEQSGPAGRDADRPQEVTAARRRRAADIANFLRRLRVPGSGPSAWFDVSDELPSWSAWAWTLSDLPPGGRAGLGPTRSLSQFDAATGASERGFVMGARHEVVAVAGDEIDELLASHNALGAAILLLARILNPNLVGITEQLDFGAAYKERAPHQRYEMVSRADSLLSILYWHLKNVLVGASGSRECRECGSLFVPSRSDQRFCPPDFGSTSSRCRERFNKRRRRSGQP